MIDLIIPVYNESEVHMLKLLGSVAIQDIYDEIEITIVDDCSTDSKEYLKAVDRFKNLLKINVISTPKNCGPGQARQYGIKQTKNKYITFADSDDEFFRTDSISLLKAAMLTEKKTEVGVCVAQFLEELPMENEMVLKKHVMNLVWMFSKMYNRDFLNKYDITFEDTSRSNEDMGFNRLCYMYSKDDEYPIIHLSVPVYIWKFNSKSITRTDRSVYAHTDDWDGSYAGFIRNRTYVINHVIQHDPHNSKLSLEIADGFFYAATSYITDAKKYPEYNEKKYQYLKDFYNKFIKNNLDNIVIKNKISDMMQIDKVQRKYMNKQELDYSPASLLDVLEKLKEN